MKTINRASSLKVMLATTITMMQLSSFSAFAIGGEPLSNTSSGTIRPGAAAALAGSPAQAQATAPATQAADPNLSSGGGGTFRSVDRDGSIKQCAPAPGSGNKIRCTIEVRSKKGGEVKKYTFIGERGTEAQSSTDFNFDANGNMVPAQQGAIRDVVKFSLEGCNGSCPQIANFQLVRNSTNILAAITEHVRTQAADVYNKEKENEVLERRRRNCEVVTVVRDGEDSEVRVKSDEDKKRFRSSILNCHVENAISGDDEESDDDVRSSRRHRDDDEDRDDLDDDDLSGDEILAKLKGPKIGGVLRRNMSSLDPQDRAWARLRIEKLLERFEDVDDRASSRYLDILLEGANEIEGVFKRAGVSEVLPQTTVAINAEFEKAAQAWGQATLKYMNVDGAGDASKEIYDLMKVRGCQLVTKTMSVSSRGIQAGFAQNSCGSIDSAVQDGTVTTETQAPAATVPGQANTVRAARVQNTSAQPGNPSFYTPVQLTVPNGVQIPGDNIQRSTTIYNQNSGGTVRGARFRN